MFHVEHEALKQPPLDIEAIKRGEFGPGQWITLVDDDRARLVLELNFGMVFVHLHLFQWKPSVMRACRAGVRELKALLRDAGYKFMHVIILDDDCLLYKWEQRMGFEELRREGGVIVMRQSTE